MSKVHNRAKHEPSVLTPEEMKAIGEIELGPSRHEKFLNRHYKKLIVLTFVIMLVSTIAIVYGTYCAKQEKDAASALIAAVLRETSPEQESDGFDLATLDHITKDFSNTKASASAELLRGIQLLAGGQEKEGKEALHRFTWRVTPCTPDRIGRPWSNGRLFPAQGNPPTWLSACSHWGI